MKRVIIFLFLLSAFSVHSQTFVTEAKIEYEKTVNTKKLLANADMPDVFKDRMPGETKTYYDLFYKNNQSLFQKGRDVETKGNQFMYNGPDERKVFTDYTTGQVTQKKAIAWDDYFVQDTMYRINWRITMDTRIIAGYECRRATAVLFDSVFVVAFYTDEIVGNGGPESFGGLPGMILGLVIPRVHTSWYATSVRPALVPQEAGLVKIPTAGKRTKIYNFPQMTEKIKEKTKNWTWEAPNNHSYIWSVLW